MSDQAQEKQKTPTKPRRGGIGNIDAAVFGSPDNGTSERSEVQTVSSPAIQIAGSSDTQNAKSSKGKKSKHPDWKQQTIYLPDEMIVWLKVQAAQRHQEISEVVHDLIQAGRK